MHINFLQHATESIISLRLFSVFTNFKYYERPSRTSLQ